jgi:hypothetical protein
MILFISPPFILISFHCTVLRIADFPSIPFASNQETEEFDLSFLNSSIWSQEMRVLHGGERSSNVPEKESENNLLKC